MVKHVNTKLLRATLLALWVLTLASCSDQEPKKAQIQLEPEFDVKIRASSEPDGMNPMLTLNEYTSHYMKLVFQQLINVDFHTLEVVPVLAEERARIEKIGDSLLLHYRIKEAASWSTNGEPITGHDVLFSLKLLKCPLVDNKVMQAYFEFISDLVVDETDPKKFTMQCGQAYIFTELASGDFQILPEHIYDPENILRGYSISDLMSKNRDFESDSNLVRFAARFNSDITRREVKSIVGSGPYTLAKWEEGQRLIFEKKENWWGNAYQGYNCFFEAYPKRLIYETINDDQTAVTALKGGAIDIMRNVPPIEFNSLKADESALAKFKFLSPIGVGVYDIRINMRDAILADVKVRKALAHMLDTDLIIDKLLEGYGERVVGPIHPSKGAAYDHSIKGYMYNLNEASRLLAEAGWSDTNKDGILDKMVSNNRIDLELRFLYNAGNDQRKDLGLVLQEEARKLGVVIKIESMEWSVYREKQKSHDFQLLAGGSGTYPAIPYDPKQMWHTESYEGGSNYSGFGNAKTDSLIEAIRIELDEDKRNVLYYKFQKIIHETVPHIFLYTKTERIAVNKRLGDVQASMIRPGYWEPTIRPPALEK